MKWFNFGKTLIACFFICFLHSCYVPRGFQKPIAIRVTSDFNCELKPMVAQPQYLYYKTADEYRNAFVEALKNQSGYSQNVTVVSDTAKADYILKITYLSLSESDRNETVNDTKSSDNGSTYVLASCDGNATYEWYDAQTGAKICANEASATKSEKVTNNRNLVQLVSGTNKDHTQYRQKMLSDDACEDVARTCGRHTWSAASAKLARYLKKRN